MSIVSPHVRVTPENLLHLPEAERYELVGGELVERNMGWESSRIGGRVQGLLFTFCEANGVGEVAPADASYQCFPDDPNKVRRPDVSFLRRERLPNLAERQGHCRVAPDLAVEVVSPNDYYSDVEAKVQEYINAGTLLVWVVNPPTRTVRVHRADGAVSDLHEGDVLSGEDIIPGFACRVADIFRMSDPTEPS
jgi:Uma2 family endonuclease